MQDEFFFAPFKLFNQSLRVGRLIWEGIDLLFSIFIKFVNTIRHRQARPLSKMTTPGCIARWHNRRSNLWWKVRIILTLRYPCMYVCFFFGWNVCMYVWTVRHRNRYRTVLLANGRNGRHHRERGRRVTTRRGLGRVDSRLPDQHPVSAHPGAAVARTHARVQAVAAGLQGPVSSLHLRPRDPLRICQRLRSLVVPRVREEGGFHSPIRRRLEWWLAHGGSSQALLQSLPRFRGSKVWTI